MIRTLKGSRRAEQLSFLSQQRIVATVEDSVLRTEMLALSLRKRMPLSVSRLVSDKHFSPRLWALRSQRFRRSRLRLVVAGIFRLVSHSKSFVGISLPIIGGGSLYGQLIGFHKCVTCGQGFVRGGPFPW